jgi:transposase-like protein
MVQTLFFCEIVLVALVWVFLMLSWLWPNDPAARYPTRPRPRPPHKRFNEPKPFAGLTQRPHCALCEQDVMPPQAMAPAPPDPLPPTHRRPRTVDTSRHFCPHADCDYRGWRGLGNLCANGHPSRSPWRQFQCTACQGYFPEHHGTIFHGKQVAVELIVRVLACLAEGVGIRATARVFEVDPNTVLGWLVEAAEQLQAFSRYLLCEVHVNQLQLDELYAVLRAVKNDELSDDEAIKHLERSPYWVWTAMDPESTLLLVMDVGTRTLAMAQCVVHQVAQVLAPDCAPLFLTDGFREYLTALLTHYGQWIQPERRRAKGARRKPRWVPLPQLLYAQVVKSYRRRRLVGVKHHVVFGTMERVKQVGSSALLVSRVTHGEVRGTL